MYTQDLGPKLWHLSKFFEKMNFPETMRQKVNREIKDVLCAVIIFYRKLGQENILYCVSAVPEINQYIFQLETKYNTTWRS